MNELIQELTMQANDETGNLFDLNHKELNVFLEKFAELLVRECCDIFVELRTRPADLAVKDVKKHFGVEK